MKTLHLLPNVLHLEAKFEFQPPAISALIAESEKGAHAYRKRYALPQMPIQAILWSSTSRLLISRPIFSLCGAE